MVRVMATVVASCRFPSGTTSTADFRYLSDRFLTRGEAYRDWLARWRGAGLGHRSRKVPRQNSLWSQENRTLLRLLSRWNSFYYRVQRCDCSDLGREKWSTDDKFALARRFDWLRRVQRRLSLRGYWFTRPKSPRVGFHGREGYRQFG